MGSVATATFATIAHPAMVEECQQV